MHTVAQGETLRTIADKYEFVDWRPIYEHPENGGLRARRPDPMVLAPGDEVFIPPKEPRRFECATNRTHRFRLKAARTRVSVALQDEAGAPYAGARYELKVGDRTYSGTTDGRGVVAHDVEPTATQGELTLWPDAADPAQVVTWTIDVGHLEPIDTVKGVQARLNNLGYAVGAVDGVLNDATRAALSDFQRALGYDAPTGELDERTRDELLRRHGR